ncbi:MAG TPA: hypothetical protein PKA60_02705 [Candidatus Paceibacterota bacterium]|nr:hypothetical protein [Candidatus Paceibacterota bacterium]
MVALILKDGKKFDTLKIESEVASAVIAHSFESNEFQPFEIGDWVIFREGIEFRDTAGNIIPEEACVDGLIVENVFFGQIVEKDGTVLSAMWLIKVEEFKDLFRACHFEAVPRASF